MNPVENDAARRPASDSRQTFLQALSPHLPRLLPLLAALLLVTEAILALVVIFSRMSAFQQFVCVVLIVVLPAAALGFGLALLTRLSAQQARDSAVERPEPARREYRALEDSPWTPAIKRSTPESYAIDSPPELPTLSAREDSASVANELAIIVEQLEEMSIRSRRLPFNVIGLNDTQFTYLLVKLRATSQNLLHGQPSNPKHLGIMPDDASILPMEAIDRIQDEMRSKRRPSRRVNTAALPSPEPITVEPEPLLVESVTEARDALRHGDAESAIRVLKNKLGRDGEDAEAAELLGIAYERSGDLDSALEAMRVAVLTDPKRASSHYNYAVLLAKADRLLDAYRQNEVALRLNPQYSAARDYQKTLQSRITTGQTGGFQAVVGAETLSRS